MTPEVQAPPTCGDCGSVMALRAGRHGPFWGCTRFPECGGAHGAHPNGQPMGVPANQETRAARIRAHAAFDSRWPGKLRNRGYRRLAHQLGMTKDECHIGRFDVAMCERVVALCREKSE